MPKTNIGRDFLFSDDCGFIKGDENGTSHKYADGSGYFTDSNGNRASCDSQNDECLERNRTSYMSNNNEDSDVSLLGLITLCGALGLG